VPSHLQVYHDHLVWSGLEQDDMRVLYKYLTQGLLKGPDPGPDAAPFFVTGPEDLHDPETPINAPRLFLTDQDDEEELHLVTYQCACGNVIVALAGAVLALSSPRSPHIAGVVSCRAVRWAARPMHPCWPNFSYPRC